MSLVIKSTGIVPLGMLLGVLIVFGGQSSATAQISLSGDFSPAYDGSDPWIVGAPLNLGVNIAGDMTVSGGSEVSSNGGAVASGFGAIASATISGSGSAWNNTGDLNVGLNGTGTLDVNSGATVTSTNATVGRNLNSDGTANIDGAGSRWDSTGALSVGNSGTGELNITNGGIVTSNGGTLTSLTGPLAQQNGSSSNVTISGAGSGWINAGNLSIGGTSSAVGGPATLNLLNGGHMTVDGTLKIWDEGQVVISNGNLEVFEIDLGSPNASDNFVIENGELNVDSVVGDLVQDGGVLTPGDSPGVTNIDGNYTFNDGTIEIELGGLTRETEFDAVLVSGTALLNNVTIEVTFIDGFEAISFDSFDIFDGLIDPASSITFDFVNAPLASSRVWDTDDFLNSGVIRAVPEPSGVLVVFAVSGLAVLRRKK